MFDVKSQKLKKSSRLRIKIVPLFWRKLKCSFRKYIKHEGNSAKAVIAKQNILGALAGSLRPVVITVTEIRKEPKVRVFVVNAEMALSMLSFYCIHKDNIEKCSYRQEG